MFSHLPNEFEEFKDWEWSHFEPYFKELNEHPLNSQTVDEWLRAWTKLNYMVDEMYWRFYVASTSDTADSVAENKYSHFLNEIRPPFQAAEQELTLKLLKSGLQPAGLEIAIRNLKAESALYRESNLPLLSEELNLATQYGQIIGAQTVLWEGNELTLSQLQPVYQSTDRQARETAWRLAASRQLEDRQTINELWVKLMDVRCKQAENADQSSYRAYRWQQLLRLDYQPDDCFTFHQAIEKVVIPAAERVYERRRRKLGLDTLRPWDLAVDPTGRPPLIPFKDLDELVRGCANIFQKIDPQLADYYNTMRREKLLDLDNRKNKAPGGYCTEFPISQRPFIFMNAVGVHDDVLTVLHEGGHAFHVFETRHLPYHMQTKHIPLEFEEVASTSMEYLAIPYLTKDQGGFYTPQESARVQVERLENVILFWPYISVVDLFQHWAYENPQAGANPAECDATWKELWKRFMPGVDWSGLEAELITGWQRKLHIFEVPFYYIEYGLAELGAAQVWRNSRNDQSQAVAAYRRALALGSTATIPQLYNAAGCRFSMQKDLLEEIVELMESTIQELEATRYN